MTKYQEEESLKELGLLAITAGAEVVDSILQDRRSIDSATLIGKGKVHQIARRATELKANLVIFDTELSPIQVKNLNQAIHQKIIDRSGLILDIFAKRARTREAQIQVELAQLQYLFPRLTKYWSHLSRQEAGIGTRGPGETQLEVDRRAIRKRIERLKKELIKIELQRKVRRKTRRDFYKVALVGYTNAGKSSLLNALSNADAFVENRLFATLDTTIRTLDHETRHNILLIDTIGLIRKLPHHLVATFRSTLEETVEADILLHVVDISHPQFVEQMGSVQVVLSELGIQNKPMITVFNKVDLLDDRRLISSLRNRFPRVVFTSAVKGIGLMMLQDKISECIDEEQVENEIQISIGETRKIAAIHEWTHVLVKEYENGMVKIRFRAALKDVAKINKLME
ncbi:GTPase HflX [bacterium]|nr:GTPase HflX [bacterium]RQV92230.1 MAG: GTPase HflX [bacterium]